jgi:rhodanese-related sulfurtransferase
MRKVSLFILVIATLFTSCTAQNSEGGIDVSPGEFKKKMGMENVILLDVRTSGEVAQGKISGSINIDIHDAEFNVKTSKLDKSKTILVYCAVGGRSGSAMKKMLKKGYTVYNLAGGINAWKAKGFEVVK